VKSSAGHINKTHEQIPTYYGVNGETWTAKCEAKYVQKIKIFEIIKLLLLPQNKLKEQSYLVERRFEIGQTADSIQRLPELPSSLQLQQPLRLTQNWRFEN
jgi:hypothetical protein